MLTSILPIYLEITPEFPDMYISKLCSSAKEMTARFIRNTAKGIGRLLYSPKLTS